MIYVVHGEQELLVQTEIDKIVKKYLQEIDDFNLINYDALKTPLHEIINDAETTNFLLDNKVIVVDNSYFLVGANPKLSFEQSFIELEQYLKKPLETTILIFTCYKASLGRSVLAKKIIENAEIKTISTIKYQEIDNYIKEVAKDTNVSIDWQAIKELRKRTNEDLRLIKQEITKLSLYTNEINLNHIETFVAKNIEENVFDIMNYLIKYNLDKALDLFEDLKLRGIEPVSLISLLNTQITFLYEVAILYNEGLSSQKIADELKVSTYRLKYALENLRYVNRKRLNTILLDLSELDFKIKNGLIERFLGFELFLLKHGGKS